MNRNLSIPITLAVLVSAIIGTVLGLAVLSIRAPAPEPASSPSSAAPQQSGYVIEPDCVYVSYDNYRLYYHPDEPAYLCGHYRTASPTPADSGALPQSCAVGPSGRIYCRAVDAPLTADTLNRYLVG